MNMLSKKLIGASEEFLEENGRPLELARFRHAFAGSSVVDVLSALSVFQNKDGGFGHALEPDLRAPESSALCTSIAFQILREVKAAPDHSIVARGIEFFVKTFDAGRTGWRIIPEEAAGSPCAPWWYQAERKESFVGFSLNPTAEILGYLHDSGSRAPVEMLSVVSERVLSQLKETDQIEMHDLLCCLRLLQTPSLPADYREQLLGRLGDLIGTTVAYRPDEWREYSLRPLEVVHSPESPFMPALENVVDANLDYELSTQNTDGSWTPTWSWDDRFPEEWAQAKTEWAGVITVSKLLMLKRFGRIEGVA